MNLSVNRKWIATSALRTMLLVCTWAVVPAASAAHPRHDSLGEAEWNPAAQRLEIALRVDPLDLERAVGRHANRPVDLERTQGVEQLILAYLNEVLTVRQSQHSVKLEWVGMELETAAIWIYLEVPLENGPHACTISHRLFFELQADQVNTLNVSRDGKLSTLVFSRESPRHTLD